MSKERDLADAAKLYSIAFRDMERTRDDLAAAQKAYATAQSDYIAARKRLREAMEQV